MDSILGSIYVYRVHDYIEQIAVVTSLEKFLIEHPLVKLVSFLSLSCLLVSLRASSPEGSFSPSHLVALKERHSDSSGGVGFFRLG